MSKLIKVYKNLFGVEKKGKDPINFAYINPEFICSFENLYDTVTVPDDESEDGMREEKRAYCCILMASGERYFLDGWWEDSTEPKTFDYERDGLDLAGYDWGENGDDDA